MSTFISPLLSRAGGLRHVFVGRIAEPRPDPRSLLRLLGGEAAATAGVARLHQVHSNRCLRVGPGVPPEGGVAGDGDALITAAPSLALAVATADCLPIIAVDPQAPALAVVHAGWRGTLAGVLAEALEAMKRDLGARTERILVGAGPAAGVCCYRVGEEVADAFKRERADHVDSVVMRREAGVLHVDLVEANRLQALDAGVPPGAFSSLGICTICQPESTHSYRREGVAAGRMWALAMLDPSIA